jgi:hypothetical protein
MGTAKLATEGGRVLERWVQRGDHPEHVLFKRSGWQRAWISSLIGVFGVVGLSGMTRSSQPIGLAFNLTFVILSVALIVRVQIGYSLTYVPARRVLRVRTPFRTRDFPLATLDRAAVIARPVPIITAPALTLVLRDGTVRSVDVISSPGQESGDRSLRAAVDQANRLISAAGDGAADSRTAAT